MPELEPLHRICSIGAGMYTIIPDGVRDNMLNAVTSSDPLKLLAPNNLCVRPQGTDTNIKSNVHLDGASNNISHHHSKQPTARSRFLTTLPPEHTQGHVSLNLRSVQGVRTASVDENDSSGFSLLKDTCRGDLPPGVLGICHEGVEGPA